MEKLSFELQKLIIVCHQNLHHILILKKQANKKKIQALKLYLGDKISLKSKYFKTKLELKFFSFFQELYLVSK